jgi:hypothetical protein
MIDFFLHARLVLLSTGFIQELPANDFHNVSFRAWDKKNDAAITGSF